MKTKTTVSKGQKIDRKWHLIDLSGQTLGRICTQIAGLLMGKNNPAFSYHRDDGDYVVAVNASKIKVTGKKQTDKKYYHHTGYAGHIRELSFKQLMSKDPRQIISIGVSGMLPKNHLRSRRLSRLKIFSDANHPYSDKIKQ